MGTREDEGRGPRAGVGGWRSGAWKAAAAAALVATGFGVWQVNRAALGPEADRDPSVALAAWEEDLDDLRPDPVDLRLAVGVEAEGDTLPGAASGERVARIVDRLAERIGQALGLDRGRAVRLKEVLHESRRARERIFERRHGARRQLAGLTRGASPEEERVALLLEELLELREREAGIERAEQRRLSRFLTPLERARVYHLKQGLARRALRRPGPARTPP